MAQSVFTTEGIKRSATMWRGLPEEILLPPISLSGRQSYAEVDIASLAHEIATRGQDTPVKIRKDKATGKPVLVYGRRRYLAVQYANQHNLGKNGPIQLEANYESNMTDEEALVAAIAENWARKEINDADHAHNIGQLLKFAKKTVEQIAAIYFPGALTADAKTDSVRWVRVRAGIEQELAPEGKQAMRDGILTTTAASELAKLPPAKQVEVIEEAKANPAKKVKGNTRIKVSDVKAHKPRKPATAPAQPSAPTPKVPATVYMAAEEMARAIELWDDEGDTEKAEEALLAALENYRKLAPAPRHAAAEKREERAA